MISKYSKKARRALGQEYDVFLSFKHLGPDGVPTRDASLAQELFDYFSANGLRVFFSSISLEKLGVAGYKRAIDDALDSAQVLVAIGTSLENLDSQWVRYEWDSFFNDILSGRKPKGRVFSYVSGVDVNSLPRTLRQNQAIVHQPGSAGLLYNFIANALAIQSVARITQDGRLAVERLHKLVEVMAESRLLELEITADKFSLMFSPERRTLLAANDTVVEDIMKDKVAKSYTSAAQKRALKDARKNIPEQVRAEFDKAFAAWKSTWFSGGLAISSNPSTRTIGKEYDALIALGPAIVSLVIEQLADPENFFALQLYDAIQANEKLLVQFEPDDERILEGEQGRAQRVVQAWFANQ